MAVRSWPRAFFATDNSPGYCYLPLYVFCGEFLLAAQLRPGDVGAMSGALELWQKSVTRIRLRWPNVCITIRGGLRHAIDEVRAGRR